MKDFFSNPWDSQNGYSYEEALQKKQSVDDAYGVYDKDSKWNPAKIVHDPKTKDGYMVTIERKSQD